MAGVAKNGELATNEISIGRRNRPGDVGHVEPADGEGSRAIFECRKLSGGMGGMVTDWTREGAYERDPVPYPGLASCSCVVGAIGTGEVSY